MNLTNYNVWAWRNSLLFVIIGHLMLLEANKKIFDWSFSRRGRSIFPVYRFNSLESWWCSLVLCLVILLLADKSHCIIKYYLILSLSLSFDRCLILHEHPKHIVNWFSFAHKLLLCWLYTLRELKLISRQRLEKVFDFHVVIRKFILISNLVKVYLPDLMSESFIVSLFRLL